MNTSNFTDNQIFSMLIKKKLLPMLGESNNSCNKYVFLKLIVNVDVYQNEKKNLYSLTLHFTRCYLHSFFLLNL